MPVSDGLAFDLTVRFPGFTLQAAEEIPAGGITVLSGPSGSGKSTLLRALAGLDPRAEGFVRLGGADWSARPASARSVGYVFQDARLFPHLDVAANLDYGARRRGTPPDRVAAIVDALDLAPLLHREPANLSGGEARRVALGRALASGPRVLLMDEPLSGLDRARKADLMPYIARAVAGFGGPALYVTHSNYEIDVLADRVLSIRDGQIVGRAGPSPRLKVRVRRVEGDWIELDLGEQSFWAPGRGQAGQALALPLGAESLLSEHAPGRSTGGVTLAGRLLAVGETGLRVDIAGQEVFLRQRPDAEDWTAGQPVWLTLPRDAGPLLEIGDSD